jgi:hypothetical protein
VVVTVSGARRLNVTLQDVGPTGGWQSCGVGGAIRTTTPRVLIRGELTLAA